MGDLMRGGNLENCSIREEMLERLMEKKQYGNAKRPEVRLSTAPL
jgi:hypothetical protein